MTITGSGSIKYKELSLHLATQAYTKLSTIVQNPRRAYKLSSLYSTVQWCCANLALARLDIQSNHKIAHV